MTGRERIVIDGVEVEVDVAVSGSENVMIPVVRIVVRQATVPKAVAPVLLQRRDNETEHVHGLLEIPGGRWKSGESPATCAKREVAEETGVAVIDVEGVTVAETTDNGSLAIVDPLVVVAGIDGRFPAVHIVLTGTGKGDPVAEPGATADVRWWPISDLRDAVVNDASGFIPSSHQALIAYLDTIGSDT